MLQHAENEIVSPGMAGLSDVYSSLPKYTSSSVVGLLILALKSDLDPTNQQVCLTFSP